MVPENPKLYHIVHKDRLPSIIADGNLWCDAEILKRRTEGTSIGMNTIKARRLTEQYLPSHPDLNVGGCVPFYFCPRSIMLYMIYRANHPELTYRGGQEPIVHLEIDLHQAVTWADGNGMRWAFTLSNAGAYYFEDCCDLSQLNKLNWDAINNNRWTESGVKEGKQAEFLIEKAFPWHLIARIGIQSQRTYNDIQAMLGTATHRPRIDIMPAWYY